MKNRPEPFFFLLFKTLKKEHLNDFLVYVKLSQFFYEYLIKHYL